MQKNGQLPGGNRNKNRNNNDANREARSRETAPWRELMGFIYFVRQLFAMALFLLGLFPVRGM